jgi:hypothetical protein
MAELAFKLSICEILRERPDSSFAHSFSYIQTADSLRDEYRKFKGIIDSVE